MYVYIPPAWTPPRCCCCDTASARTRTAARPDAVLYYSML